MRTVTAVELIDHITMVVVRILQYILAPEFIPLTAVSILIPLK